jgi:hypothetical protein
MNPAQGPGAAWQRRPRRTGGRARSPGVAQRQDPRRRPDRRGAADSEDPGARAIPIRTPVRRLDRLDAERSFDRPRFPRHARESGHPKISAHTRQRLRNTETFVRAAMRLGSLRAGALIALSNG